MAAIYNGPARGGNRGGKDQFNWDDVKEDKNHQSYLGHSVKAPIGRWQKGRDLTWYTKQSKVDLKAAQDAERREIKLKEQDLMLQMLGEKPMEPAPRADLDRIQKNKLLKKGDAEEGTVAAAISQDDFGERVEGIGYAPIKIDDLRQAMETATSTRLEGTGINEMIAAHAAGDGATGHDDHAALLAAIEGEPLSKEDKRERKRVKKEIKKLQKAEKAEKKAEKAEKKAAKAEKKAAKESKSAAKPKPDDPHARARASDFFRPEPEPEPAERGRSVVSPDRRAADRFAGAESRRHGSEDRPPQRDARGRDRGRETSPSWGRGRDGRRSRSRSGPRRRSRSGGRQPNRRRSVSLDRDRGGRSRERFGDGPPGRSLERPSDRRPPPRAGRRSRSGSRGGR